VFKERYSFRTGQAHLQQYCPIICHRKTKGVAEHHWSNWYSFRNKSSWKGTAMRRLKRRTLWKQPVCCQGGRWWWQTLLCHGRQSSSI